MTKANFYLLFKNLNIQQANAISSPLTYGFPAISGFVGAIHNLNRKIQKIYPDISLNGVLIACHHYELQAYRTHSYADYTFNQTRNPLKKNGNSASIIEEGKIHINISLVVEVTTSSESQDKLNNKEYAKIFATTLSQLLTQQRIAGGSVLDLPKTQLFTLSESGKILDHLQPAFILMDATPELLAITKELQTGIKYHVNDGNIIMIKDENDQPVLSHYVANPDATALDALLETACLHHIPLQTEDLSMKWDIKNIKQNHGWLVPIPIGYQGIYPPFSAGELKQSRSITYPSQYVEILYSLGKWVFPYRLKDQFEQCFWRYTTPQDNLYLYQQGESNE